MAVHITDILSPPHTHCAHIHTHTPASSNKRKCSWPQCTLRPIKHSDLPPLGFVRHQLPTMCSREETPAPEQKIYSSITIRPDTNILPLHFHTAAASFPSQRTSVSSEEARRGAPRLPLSFTAESFLRRRLGAPRRSRSDDLVSCSV